MNWKFPIVLLALFVAALFLLDDKKFREQQALLSRSLVSEINQSTKTQASIVGYCNKNSSLAEQNAELLRQNDELKEAVQEAISYIKAQEKTIQELHEKLGQPDA